MARKKKILFNEHDENQVTKVLKIKKMKKLKLRVKILFALVLIALAVGFFVSDASKVKSIKIEGISDIKKEDVKNVMAIDENDYYFLVDTNNVAERIKTMPLVKKVTVKKSFFGNIKVDIEESEKIAYGKIGKKIYLVDEQGKIASTKDEKIIESLKFTPQLIGFKSITFLKEFIDEYLTIPDIIKNQVSDIVFEPTSSDKTKIKFIMDNGKILYIRVEDMSKQLNSIDYEAMITGYKNHCVFSFEGGYIYTKECE